MIWVSERTIPTERPPLIGEAIANFCGYRVPRGQRDGSRRPYSRFSRQEPLLFYQVAPQLYSRGWVDPFPDPLLFFLVVPEIEYAKIAKVREKSPLIKFRFQYSKVWRGSIFWINIWVFISFHVNQIYPVDCIWSGGPCISVSLPRTTTAYLSQDNRYPGRDSNQRTYEHKPRELLACTWHNYMYCSFHLLKYGSLLQYCHTWGEMLTEASTQRACTDKH
jgi:hypothetical protein